MKRDVTLSAASIYQIDERGLELRRSYMCMTTAEFELLAGMQAWADRRYTGPDCPPDMLEVGGIPQGDYVPVPWLVSDQGYSLWLETLGDGGRASGWS